MHVLLLVTRDRVESAIPVRLQGHKVSSLWLMAYASEQLSRPHPTGAGVKRTLLRQRIGSDFTNRTSS